MVEVTVPSDDDFMTVQDCIREALDQYRYFPDTYEVQSVEEVWM